MNAHSSTPTPQEALRLAVMRAGGQQKLADFLKVSRASVSAWDLLPAQHVLKVEAAFNIPGRWLHPDMFPDNESERFIGVDRRAASVSFQNPRLMKGKAA